MWKKLYRLTKKQKKNRHTQTQTHTLMGTALWGITGRRIVHNTPSNRVKETVGECE